MTPFLRRLAAPGSTSERVRQEIASPDPLDYLPWACATWGVVVLAAGLGSVPTAFLATEWSGFTVVVRGLVACSALALLPLLGYLVAWTWQLVAERRRLR